jgi:hypothetical protein
MCEAHELLAGRTLMYARFYSFCYQVVPLFFIPLIAFNEDNVWICLIGLFSYFGSYMGSRKAWMPVFIPIFFIVEALLGNFSFGSWEFIGYLCFLWGYIWYLIADNKANEYAQMQLIRQETLFKSNFQTKRIIVTRNDQ